MILIVDLSEVIATTGPNTIAEYANLLETVEHILTSYYAIPAISSHFNPVRFQNSLVEQLIHHKLKQVLDPLRFLAHQCQTLYIDFGINGSLIISTEKLQYGHHRLYTHTLPNLSK